VFVRIIATPPGEAPEEVRRAWVGLELPLAAGETGPRELPVGGVLTGPRSIFAQLLKLLTGERRYAWGYVIDAPQALTLLVEHAPQAARWWRQYAPHCWEPGRRFLFPAEVCADVSRHHAGLPPAPPRAASDAFTPADPREVTRNPTPRPPDVREEEL
jgi:hypothetical protein